MNEAILNESEINKVINEPELGEIGISGKITKEEITALSETQREKLKQVIGTNSSLASLLSEVNATAAIPPSANPDNEEQKPQEPDNAPQAQVESPTTFDGKYKKEGYSDVYILARALELGYIPKYHDAKIGDVLKGDKKIRNTWTYAINGGPVTNDSLLSKSGNLNKDFYNYVKKYGVEAVDIEKVQAREILEKAKNMTTVDRNALDRHFNILNKLETALNGGPGNMANIRAAFKEYKENFGADKSHAFKKFQEKYRVKLHLGNELQTVNRGILANKLKDTRFNTNKTYSNLHLQHNSLEIGDAIVVNRHVPGGSGESLEIRIRSNSVVGGARKIMADVRYMNNAGNNSFVNQEVKFNGNHIEVVGNPSVPHFDNITDYSYSGSDLMERRSKKLNQIKAEMSKTPMNSAEVRKLRMEYERDFSTTLTKGNRINTAKNAIKETDSDIKVLKKEIQAMDEKIIELKKEAVKKISALDKAAKSDPGKISEFRREGKEIVDKINTQIAEMEKKGVKLLTSHKIDAEALKTISSESKMVQGLEKMNAGFDTHAGKYGKWLIGASVIGITFGARGAFAEVWRGGPARHEFIMDMIDMGAGIVPVAGGVHDLVIAGRDMWFIPDKYEAKYRGIFGNKHEHMTQKDKNIRTGFGVVGLIPGGAYMLKAGAKMTGVVKAAHVADGAIEGAKLAGKTFTFGYLGITLADGLITSAVDLSKKL